MIASTYRSLGIIALMFFAVACDRTETRNAPVTTTSPAGTSTAPSAASAKTRDHALVRVVDAAPSASFDLFAGDLVLFDALSFKAVTPYRALDGNRYAFTLRPAGMTLAKPLSSNTEDLRDGDFYTAFALPGDGHGPHLRIVNDQLDAPAAGKARVRIVHAGTEAGQVDVRASGAAGKLFDDLAYQTVSDYRDVAAMNGAVEIVQDNSAAAVLATLNVHLEPGRFYTIVIAGSTRGTPKLEAFLIEDALSP